MSATSSGSGPCSYLPADLATRLMRPPASASETATDPHATERARRWRLALGPDAESPSGASLTANDAGMDSALHALYGSGGAGAARDGADRRGGLGSSAPSVARWLGDIRSYFPSSVVRVMYPSLFLKFTCKSFCKTLLV